MYVGYCVFMAFSSRIEGLVKSKVPVPQSWNVSQAHASGVDGAAAGTTVVGTDPEAAKGFGSTDSTKQNGQLKVILLHQHKVNKRSVRFSLKRFFAKALCSSST